MTTMQPNIDQCGKIDFEDEEQLQRNFSPNSVVQAVAGSPKKSIPVVPPAYTI